MKKGFTLIELLGVLVILSAIIAISVPAVNHVIKNAKNSLSKTQIKNIEIAAKQYYLSEGSDTTTCVNLSYLIENDYFSDSDLSEEKIKKGSVKITYNGNQYNYEYQEKTCGICQVIEGSGNSIGDKLECEVKPGTKYNFYILSRNEDETINLIMDRNICEDGTEATASNPCYVAWNKSGDNTKGPVTAMDYLSNSTSNWNNLTKMTINKYNDEEDNTYDMQTYNVYARLPKYSEVYDSEVYDYNEETGEYAYLYDNLGYECYDEDRKPTSCYNSPFEAHGVFEDGITHIDNINGYWTSTSDYELPDDFAWSVSYFDYVNNNSVDYVDVNGVRPVITIKKDDINPYNPPSVICKSVTEDTVTTGNVPNDNYEPGDEYICEVKPGTKYHFFAISEEDDNVNLIMERNVYYNSDDDNGVATDQKLGFVPWVSKEDYKDDTNYGTKGNNNKGPVTSMTYLHNATKDWINVPNIAIDYEDENMYYVDEILKPGNQYGYGGIKTENNVTKIMMKDGTITNGKGYTNLKARLPRFDEVHGDGKCLTYVENGNKYGTCPFYLVNYLNEHYEVTFDELTHIDGIHGYWLLPSRADSSDDAWRVYYAGSVNGLYDVAIEVNYGVRPVISIPKNRIK